MEQQGTKKEWVVPELLVLVRSHPEEDVLARCKLFEVVLDGYNMVNNSCAIVCNAAACVVPGQS